MTNSLIQWALRILGGVTKEQWVDLLRWVATYAEKQLTGEQKRAHVLALLKSIGITGSRANGLIEMAVMWLKRIGEIAL
jgi:hypothetical protein